MFRRTYRLVRRLARTALGKQISAPLDVRLPTRRIGTAYGGWTIYPAPLNSMSVVYSFGIGEDVSFDLGLIEHYGVTVHAFDPTPKSLAWIRAQSIPSALVVHAVGLAAFDGAAVFAPPADPTHVSHRMTTTTAGASQGVTVDVRRISTLMEQLGHSELDVLKMDIEGAEYEVIDDLLATGPIARQLLVEFHDRFPSIGRERTRTALRQLRHLGYRLFAVSERGEEFSFVRRDVAEGIGG